MFLTVDLGTTTTKATLWDDDRQIAVSRHALATRHPAAGRAEQDPSDWWDSVGRACRELDSGPGLGQVEALGFAAARETFVPVRADGSPLGPALLWSDRRAAEEAAELTRRFGPEPFHQRTGVILGAGSMAAKVTWLAVHQPERLSESRWLLAPRDLIAWRMTGEVATDATLASRTGFYDIGGAPLGLAGELAGERLAPVRTATSVLGELLPAAAEELGLPPGTPVVLGAGDRACEVLGSGALETEPVVSWGTTTNMSFPVSAPPPTLPSGLSLSRGALGGYLIEAGTSSSGQAISWLSELTGRDVESLYAGAARTSPGANGVIAVPWMNGARAPWWESSARAGLIGLSPATTSDDVARALIESVAFEVVRCLEAAGSTAVERLRAVGAGVVPGAWVDILAGACRRAVAVPRYVEAASVGALLVISAALGRPLDPARINPISAHHPPRPDHVDVYVGLRPASDALAEQALLLAQQLWSPTVRARVSDEAGSEDL